MGLFDRIKTTVGSTATNLAKGTGTLAAKGAVEAKEQAKKEEVNKAPSVNYNEFLIKSMYEALKEGINQKNVGYLSNLFKEMEDYDLGEHKDRFKRLHELFEASDFDGMTEVLKEVE